MEQHRETHVNVDKPKHEGTHHPTVVPRSEGANAQADDEDEGGQQVDEEVDAILELQFVPAEQRPQCLEHAGQHPGACHYSDQHDESLLSFVRILIEVVVSLFLVALETHAVDDEQEGEVDQIEGHFEALDPLPSRVTHHVEVVLDVCHEQHYEHSHLHHLEHLPRVRGRQQHKEVVRVVEGNET